MLHPFPASCLPLPFSARPLGIPLTDRGRESFNTSAESTRLCGQSTGLASSLAERTEDARISCQTRIRQGYKTHSRTLFEYLLMNLPHVIRRIFIQDNYGHVCEKSTHRFSRLRLRSNGRHRSQIDLGIFILAGVDSSLCGCGPERSLIGSCSLIFDSIIRFYRSPAK